MRRPPARSRWSPTRPRSPAARLPRRPGVKDYVGYGTANDSETAPAAAACRTRPSAARTDPTKDTDNNGADFAAGNPSPGTLTAAPPARTAGRREDPRHPGRRAPVAAGRQEGRRRHRCGHREGANGFWFQDPQPDDDPATSEGLFVFTSSAPTVAVGDAVTVEGTVAEFRPGGSGGTDNLTTTELTNPTITVTGTAAATGADHRRPGRPGAAVDRDRRRLDR